MTPLNLLEKLDYLKKKTGDNNNSLSRKSGIPYSTIDNLYKKGYENMKLSTLEALCEYFNVTMDYLVFDHIEEEIPMRTVITSDTQFEKLADVYNRLSADGKRMLLLQADFLLSREESETKKGKGSVG